ncbi:hypothetical protein ERX27_04920 [Macrococcus brunensis]|uniref:Uncharacterized protein n=1 Tax=Macrococcus brunensis TaxID=198483 RepID=A0A4R6BDZ0_9STAP|nr:hypothetical protein [Macrococcus brunensis]TDL98021.1 hypothetical protein ERX27_04920 [Macrococcus brunensis]ULG72343.1 hypothetical protein MGG12_02110 [Macrococcus brunensis]ULG74604.1 hypothetical protein MGG13_02190 [Macrococcus brunensis]
MIDEKIEAAFDAYDLGDDKETYRLFDEMKNELTPGTEDYVTYQHALGYLYIAEQKFDAAREHYLEMLDAAGSDDEAAILHQLGTVEQLDSEFEQAEVYFQQEEKLLDTNDAESLAANYYAQGYTKMLSGDYDSALSILNKAQDQAQDDMSRAHAERALGELYAAQSQMAEAKGYFTKAKKHFRAAGDEVGAAEIEMLESIIFE